MMALELWTGPGRDAGSSGARALLWLSAGPAPWRGQSGVPGLLGTCGAWRGERRAQHPVGNSPAGQWPGGSEASSANPDYNQMSQGLPSLLRLRSTPWRASPPRKGRRAQRGHSGGLCGALAESHCGEGVRGWWGPDPGGGPQAVLTFCPVCPEDSRCPCLVSSHRTSGD